MDQESNNNPNEFLWTLLANPAEEAHLYAYNLQRLVNDFPQSGILHALLAHASDEKNLKRAAAYFNSRSLYKLINAPSALGTITDEKIVKQGWAGTNGHVHDEHFKLAGDLESHAVQNKNTDNGEAYFSEFSEVETEPGKTVEIGDHHVAVDQEISPALGDDKTNENSQDATETNMVGEDRAEHPHIEGQAAVEGHEVVEDYEALPENAASARDEIVATEQIAEPETIINTDTGDHVIENTHVAKEHDQQHQNTVAENAADEIVATEQIAEPDAIISTDTADLVAENNHVAEEQDQQHENTFAEDAADEIVAPEQVAQPEAIISTDTADLVAENNHVAEEQDQQHENTFAEDAADEIAAPEQVAEPDAIISTDTANHVIESNHVAEEQDEQQNTFAEDAADEIVATEQIVEREALQPDVAEDEVTETPGENRDMEVAAVNGGRYSTILPGLNDEEEKLIVENIAATDFFMFDRAFGGGAQIDQTEDTLPAATGNTSNEAEATIQLTSDVEHQDVSKYHDEEMPYTFMWWLDKTRKEHAGIYQPYAKPEKQNRDKKKSRGNDELQHQYYENIFHITSIEDLENIAAPRVVKGDTKRKEHVIIERFILEEPQIKPQSSDKLDNENKAKKSSEDRDELVTETLADIYVEQMLYHKAIAVYKKLMLKFPEKSRYFAGKIEQLEKKTN